MWAGVGPMVVDVMLATCYQRCGVVVVGVGVVSFVIGTGNFSDIEYLRWLM